MFKGKQKRGLSQPSVSAGSSSQPDAWYQYEGDRGPSRSVSQAGTDGIPPTKLKGILGQLFKGKGKLAPHARVSKLPPQLSPLDGKLPSQLSPLDEWTQFDPVDEPDVGALFKPIVPRAYERSLPRLPDKGPDEPARHAALERLIEELGREERQVPEAIDARLPNPHDYEPREDRDSPESVSPEPQMQETIDLDSVTSDAETPGYQVSPQSIQERRSQTSASQNFLNPLIYPYQGRQVPSVRAQTLDNRVPTTLFDWRPPQSSQTVSPTERKLNNPWPLIEDASAPPIKQSLHNPWPIIEDEDSPAEDESMPRDFGWSRISPQPPLKESPLSKPLELPPPIPPPFIPNEFFSQPLNRTRATPYAASSSAQPVAPPAGSSSLQPFMPPLPRRGIRNQMHGSQPQSSSSAQPVAPLLIDVPRRSETLGAMPPPRHPQMFNFDFDRVFATQPAGPSSVQPVAPQAIDTLRVSQSTAVQQPLNREYIFGQGHGEQSTGSSSTQPVTPPLLSELTVANQSHLTHDVRFNFDQMHGEQSVGRSSTQSAVPSTRSVPSEVPIKSESPETIQSHRSTHDDKFAFDQIQGEQSAGPSSPQLVTPSPRSLHSEVPLESDPEIIQSHPLTHNFGFIFDQMQHEQSASPSSSPAHEPTPLPQIPGTVGNEMAEIPHPGGSAHAFDPDEDGWYTEEEHSLHEQQLGLIEEPEYDKSSERSRSPSFQDVDQWHRSWYELSEEEEEPPTPSLQEPLHPSPRRPATTFTCCICLDEHPEDDIAYMEPCLHAFCRDSIKGHISMALKDHKYPIFCPMCTTNADSARRPSIITNEVAQVLGLTYEENEKWRELEMSSFSLIIHCRLCQREAFVARDEYDEATLIACPLPDCLHEWCKFCQKTVTWDEAMTHTCDVSGGLDQLVNEQGWKKCPGCRTLIHKIDGCNHIRCEAPGCNTHFCYLCGDPIIQSALAPEIEAAVTSHYETCQLFEDVAD